MGVVLWLMGYLPLSVEIVDCSSGGDLVNTAACPDKRDQDPIEGSILALASFFMWAAAVGSVIMVIVGSIRLVLASGNPEKRQAAIKVIQYALIGLVASASIGLVLQFVVREVVDNT